MVEAATDQETGLVGLAIVIAIFRQKTTVDISQINLFKY